MVRTYKGEYDVSNKGLTRGERAAEIKVTAGDVLTIVVGDPSWPSMSNGQYGANAETVPAGVYTLTIAAAPQGWDGKTATQPTKGDGSTEDPYQITSAAELAWLRNNINTRVASQGGYGSAAEKEAYGSAVLMNDIDLNDQEWVPISVVTSNGAEKGYTGTFNGNGHTIFGLNAIVDPNTTDAVGAALFGHVYGGTIKNLTVKGISNGKNYTAGIAAILFNGTISDCTSDVTVNGARMIGGITGYMSNADCKLIRCANTGNITGNDTGAVGGVCGTANKGEINACYNSGTVTCTGNRRQTGGIAASGAAKITDCYNTGNVVTNTKKSKQVGGIVGYYSGTSLSNCYNTGAITASSNVGAILGGGGSGIENCYYDNTGTDANEATTALPAADINTARFATKLGAAFGSLGSGAPVLMWQTGAKGRCGV